jgi:hypothetical protein
VSLGKLVLRRFIVPLWCALFLFGCGDGSITGDPLVQGVWVDGVQTDFIKIYVSELRFDDGKYEWWWDGDLQQRGIYDTEDGVLTLTVEHSYASPQRLLGDMSRPYAITDDTLMWGGWRFTKK